MSKLPDAPLKALEGQQTEALEVETVFKDEAVILPSGRKIRERKLVVDDLLLDVSIDEEDPEPPPGNRCPKPRI